MAWPEISIEDFPPERDDEPTSLRQDILDELTDHFVCAFNRELLKNSDERLAQERVIKQFGDPVKIARQLWFDAMKERIMSQRIMTGISAVMAVCCIAVVGIAWILMRDSQLVNRQMLDQLAVIADRPQADSTVVKSLQSTNEAIVRELRILAESQRPLQPLNGMGMSEMMGTVGGGVGGGFGMAAKPAEPSNINQQILKQLEQLNQKQGDQESTASEGMNRISFQLVQDNKDKKPAVGFTGNLTKSGNQTDSFTLEAVTNKSGKLDFGKLPWGKYYLNLKAPWGESFVRWQLTVIPGRDYSQTIMCPSAAPEEVPVQFQVNWSKTLKTKGWFLLCDFRQTRSGGGGIFSYFFNSTRKVGDDYWMTDQNQPLKPRGVYLVDSDNQVSLCPLTEDGRFEDIDPDSVLEKPTVNMLEGEYNLPVVYLIPNKDLKQLSLLNSANSYKVIKKNRVGTYSYKPHNVSQRAGNFGGGGFFGGQEIPTTAILVPFKRDITPSDSADFFNTVLRNENANGIQLPKLLKYSAKKDQLNLWEIKLSD